MLTFAKIVDLQAFLSTKREQGVTIGFVPTMGALHEGHLSLIARSRAECGLTVCSIFVNPTQFNDTRDLEKYPRTPEKDEKMLEKAGCDVIFSPKVEEMYPKTQKTNFIPGPVSEVLEGSYRPGHFKGVAQVVKRFFEIVEPHNAYFGTKDYQQLLVIRDLVKQMRSSIQVIGCPIIREPDGLAMSSRNSLLSSEERKIAANIPRILKRACNIAATSGVSAAKDFFGNEISKFPPLKPEYFEICDPETLRSLSGNPDEGAIALAAVWLNRVRLIDNMPVRDDSQAATGRQARSLNQR